MRKFFNTSYNLKIDNQPIEIHESLRINTWSDTGQKFRFQAAY